ncbi:MAG: TadE/TadG family type IV pilus assembly protein, partial [Thermoguttaceae bacterium]
MILDFTPSRQRPSARRGAAVVEFAVTAPLLIVMVFGMVEASRLYEMQNQLLMAAREGARLAAMDRKGILAPGESLNNKMIDDVRTYLNAAGLPGDTAAITIEDPDLPGTTLNLSDPANDLALFRLSIRVPYSSVRSAWAPNP